MVENWLSNLNNNCPEGYEVRDSPAFLMRAQDVIGSIKEWDEIRRHDWALTRNAHIGQPIHGTDLWMRRIDYDYILVLFHTVDEDKCEVMYQDVRRLD